MSSSDFPTAVKPLTRREARMAAQPNEPEMQMPLAPVANPAEPAAPATETLPPVMPALAAQSAVESKSPFTDPSTLPPPVQKFEVKEPPVTVDSLLKELVTKKGSDLHLVVGLVPKGRVHGDVMSLSPTMKITPEWMLEQIQSITTPAQFAEYKENGELDFSHSVHGYGRFRVNLFRQLGVPGAVMRSIPSKILTLEELGLPAVFSDITHKPNGLVLVTGPTGSGKSTTLAAMIEARNRMYSEHIMTIEDPIEFTYDSKKAIINQREVGSDTKSFMEALRRVLRQDPDVILIGELRDAETTKIALTAAETGHLVFGTLHTQSAAKSINRIIDQFPSDQQNQIRSQLGDTLRAIISQTLLKKIDGGRVAATEVLVNTVAIANQINNAATAQLYSSIQTGKAIGMHTLDQDLIRLIQDGVIDKETARPFMVNKKELDLVF